MMRTSGDVSDQVQAWRRLAADFCIDVVAPCEIQLTNGSCLRATAHIKDFGAENGMVVDPDYSLIEPYADILVADGYGYSAVEVNVDWGRTAVIDMMADWGWTSSCPHPPWLPAMEEGNSK